MAASFSALQFGFLPWGVKWCQDTVWSDRPKKIKEVDAFLYEIDLALPALADRITRHQRSELEKLLKRIRTRHRHIADQNVKHYLALVDMGDKKRLHLQYHEYLADETTHLFREWQKEDRNNLRELLATIIAEDRRLQGYYDIGNHLGEAIDVFERDTGPLSKKERAYILSGIKKLPLREQRETQQLFVSASRDIVKVAKQVKKLGRFLKSHEDDLVATPQWDGKTIAYRGKAEEVRIQNKSVMTTILDEAEAQGWPDAIRLSPEQMGNKRSVSNAIYHFQCEHKLVEFTVNGDRIMWGPPGTMKRTTKRSTRSV